MDVLFVIVILLLKYKCILSVKAKVECGYKQCSQTRDGALNVHLIPHSHMDAGWVKTFDEYYFGTKTSISTANVQLIYHSVLSELLHDKRRKFTLSETAYFWRWWKEQRPTTRATFRTLVQEGRIEFAGGGWVQNDEATPDYLQIIDQYTWGLRKLNDTLGPCGKPKAAWQIDTYGHSREQISLLAQMGFDGLFLGRVDHKEREAMIEEDRMEFMWRGSDVLEQFMEMCSIADIQGVRGIVTKTDTMDSTHDSGPPEVQFPVDIFMNNGKMTDIMSHVLFNLYNAPDGFCFDFLCNDEPIIDDPDSQVYNADKRVNDFISQIERQAKYYDHDNIMVTMGGDFTYQSAANWFMNMDKLINHVNTHPANISDINIFYSTPSCYLKAIYLYGRRDKAIFTERGDHLPYGSDSLTYWTGFYASRPSLKYLVKRAHVFLQVVKQLSVIARMSDSYELHLLRHAVSLVLHHDAITGTSQQHVTNDIIRILTSAIDVCVKKVSNLLSYLTPTWGGSRRSKNNQQFIVCLQLNMSQCRFTETQESMLVLVYNSLSVKTYFHVRLPAVALHYTIRDFNDEEVEYQLIPLPAAVINLPGRGSTAIQELCFEAENIPPLGYTAYYIAPVRDQLEENDYAKKTSQGQVDLEHELIPFISNEYLKVAIDKTTGLLQSIQHVDGVRIDLTQNFHYYSQSQQPLQSGAYSFRPEKQRPVPVTERVSYNTVRGSLVKEIRQRFSDWITQIIRLYRGEEFVELEWIIGPVPIGTDLGKEVVSLFTTNITNSGEFFTDSNSRQMMKRTCWNETASQQQKKPVAACFYPVPSRLCIRSLNSSVEMCVLTDRAQGGTSYNEGEIELMVHRRLLTDDGFGLEETLNEEAYGAGLVIKGKHRIVFGNFRHEMDDQTFSERISSSVRKWQYEPWLFFTSGEKINRRKWQNVRNRRFSALKLHGLPRHVHVLTLEPWKAGSVLLRLENTLETPVRDRFRTDKTDGPDDYNSKPTHITVELRKIFLQMHIKSVRETTLAANQWLDDARQMDWSTRYVYNGADDGLLPEDAEDTIDKSSKQNEPKDSAHYSYEDQDYVKTHVKTKSRLRQRSTEKAKSKIKRPYDDYDRRKRSANNTDYAENLINGTVYHYNNIENVTKVLSKETFGMKVYHQNKSLTENDFLNNSDVSCATKKTPRLGFMSRMRPSRVREWEDSGEVTSSEEDFSSNMRRRAPRKKYGNKSLKKWKEETITDDTDDGITRSIYDMYYRTKPKNPYKLPRSSKDDKKKRSRRTKNENMARSRRKGRRRMSTTMPFFFSENRGYRSREFLDVRPHRRDKMVAVDNVMGESITKAPTPRAKRNMGVRSEEYDEDDDDDEYDDEEDMAKRRKHRREKRMLPKEEHTENDPVNSEEPEQAEPDYIITLRPTQIRTFVVWFETTKKSYV